ncbi:hypothetical protein PGT21_030495 [Puccinia graminis f. sp. tritici]|uniref:Uncharacterized protein n=1 Tax=Puccinia graminis f. sp. tritici TaxID=56615 RepID=A0A5B0Q777_PUCGR|nr:hypothetical protein PGT21_030495 [Puccinia graminis f. sp. tritici]
MDELFRALFSCICLSAAGSSACKSGDEVAAAGVYRPGSKSLGEDTLLPFSASVPMDAPAHSNIVDMPLALTNGIVPPFSVDCRRGGAKHI